MPTTKSEEKTKTQDEKKNAIPILIPDQTSRYDYDETNHCPAHAPMTHSGCFLGGRVVGAGATEAERTAAPARR